MLPSRDQQHEEHRDWNKPCTCTTRPCMQENKIIVLPRDNTKKITNVGPNPPCRVKWGTGLKLHTCTTLHLGTNRAINRSLCI